jgi:secondary thiamine-phosphate synthase enzyme
MFVQIEVQSRNKVDFLDITEKVQSAIGETDVQEGICFLYCPHTTAGIVLNENWDPSVEKDLTMLLDRMVPQNISYRHGEGNSPAHIKSVLVGSDHFIFIRQGRLKMGRWQGIFFADFDGPRRRNIWLRVIRDEDSG